MKCCWYAASPVCSCQLDLALIEFSNSTQLFHLSRHAVCAVWKHTMSDGQLSKSVTRDTYILEYTSACYIITPGLKQRLYIMCTSHSTDSTVRTFWTTVFWWDWNTMMTFTWKCFPNVQRSAGLEQDIISNWHGRQPEKRNVRSPYGFHQNPGKANSQCLRLCSSSVSLCHAGFIWWSSISKLASVLNTECLISGWIWDFHLFVMARLRSRTDV